MTTNELPALLTVPQVMEQTGLSRSTIYNLIASKELASVRIGNLRRIPREALQSFIQGALDRDSARA